MTGAIAKAFDAREKASAAQETAMSALNLPSAADVLDSFKQKYSVSTVDPYAIYGYETMALALDVLKRAGDKAGDRAAVVKELFNTKGRQGVIGTYDIDANGDTTLTDYGLYTVKGGLPTYEKKIVAAK